MYRGNSTRAGGKEPGPEGFITFGMNPVGIGPNIAEGDRGALEAEVAGRRRERRDRDGARSGRRPKEYGGARRRRRSRPRSSCSRPPASPRRTARSPTPRAGCSGSGRRSIRRARRRPTRRSSRASSSPCGTSTGRRAARCPKQVLNVTWNYTNPVDPDLGEVLKEINGKALADIPDPKDKTKMIRRRPASSSTDFGQLQDDGSTMCGNWLHSGVYTEAGNNAAAALDRRPDRASACIHNWGFSWPANRRDHVQPRLRRRGGQALGSEARRASSGTARSGSATSPTSSPTRRPASSARSS